MLHAKQEILAFDPLFCGEHPSTARRFFFFFVYKRVNVFEAEFLFNVILEFNDKVHTA